MPQAADRRGFFVSFEGIDGAGKSTQVAALAASLRAGGVDAITVRPTDTPLGEMVRSLVLQHRSGAPVDAWAEALLFVAGRAQLPREVILPALQRGATVIADRFADSTLAYQGGGRGLPMAELLRLHEAACDGIWPDLTVYLDVPLALASSRQHDQQLPLDRIEVAPETFHTAVRDTFEQLARSEPERIVRVDASRPALTVSTEIARLVEARRRVHAHARAPAVAPG